MNEERRAELERLLAQSPSLIADFFGATPEPEDELEDLILDGRAEAAARFDPTLSGLRNSQYTVRIRRDDGADLLIDGPSVREVMQGIETEVDAAARGARDEAKLELASLTKGSVVLHYRAVRPFATVDEGQFDHGLSVVDAAISRVSELHRAIEQREPVAKIVMIAQQRDDLLQASRGLIESLQKNGLNLSTRWRNAGGKSVTSKISRVGKEHASMLFEKIAEDEPIFVAGIVTSISLDGRFEIKTPKKYEVQGSQLTIELIRGQQIKLGEVTHMTLREEVSRDRVGLKSRPKYQLIGLDDRLVP